MARQLMTVCMLCFLCASHAQCSGSHAAPAPAKDFHAHHHAAAPAPRSGAHCPQCRRLRRDLVPSDHDRPEQGGTDKAVAGAVHPHHDAHEEHEEQLLQLRRIFERFGDASSPDTLSFDAFARLVHSGSLTPLLGGPATDNANATPLAAGAATGASINNGSSSTSKDGSERTSRPERQGTGSAWTCVGPSELLARYGLEAGGPVGAGALLKLCPVLLARAVAPTEVERANGCVALPPKVMVEEDHLHEDDEEDGTSVKVWLCATGSILVVSLCGLLGVGVIPFMQKLFYQQLLQFLVALAVGTLTGDALLHLLPHAFLGPEVGHGHHHHAAEADPHAQHNAAVWRGLAACSGLIFFFVTEKCLMLVAEWRKRRQRRSHPTAHHQHRVRVMRDGHSPALANSAVNGGSAATGGKADNGLEPDGAMVPRKGGKQCKHKYSSYPYCYGEISDAADIPASGEAERLTAATRLPADPIGCLEDSKLGGAGDGNDLPDVPDVPADLHASECESYTVIIREHETAHHGHSHAHGHVHAAPQSLSSVAWMVVMGDGLHNFTDGVAIGAAFAAGLPGGFSTALAVLCHELPHEIGDFAVLLKAGMSLKQAVFYNVLSSLLCLLGMLIGVALGHNASATPWVFGAAAGMFLYIALVDMIPELSSNHSQEGGSICQCVLQVLGLICGASIMLLIAVYEHDLKAVFSAEEDMHPH